MFLIKVVHEGTRQGGSKESGFTRDPGTAECPGQEQEALVFMLGYFEKLSEGCRQRRHGVWIRGQ